MPPRRDVETNAEVERLVAERLAAAIAAHDAARNLENPANGGGGAGGNAARSCNYKDFLHCKPNNFNGTEGAVGLIQWFEKMESVFSISNCEEASKVKFATCTLQTGALTWWNTYAKSVGLEVAHQLPWEELKLKMIEKYCPRNELKKIEAEFWNLTVKGNDIEGYTNRFHELALLCPNMVEPEHLRIERYISGLPPHIQDGVTTSKPVEVHDAIKMAHGLMDNHVRRGGGALGMNTAERSHDKKRKWNDGNQGQQQASDSGTRTDSNSGYKGRLPFCNRCNRHHTGPCGNPCEKCKRYGHQTKDCRSTAPVNNPTPTNAANQGAPRTCFECGLVGHFRNNCPKLKGQDTEPANGRVYMLTNGETHQEID